MTLDAFDNHCSIFCDRLIADAKSRYPNWSTHPREKKRISQHRYELNKRLKLPDAGSAICQYVFTPDRTIVALYLTMLAEVGTAAGRLENVRTDIEHACASRVMWEFNRDTAMRFVVDVKRRDGIQIMDDSVDRLVTDCVESMRVFQGLTLPLLGLPSPE